MEGRRSEFAESDQNRLRTHRLRPDRPSFARRAPGASRRQRLTLGSYPLADLAS